MDWIVWPIFVVQAVAFLLMFLRAKTRFLGMSVRTVIIVLVIACDIAIAVSLYHDSTTILHLYF